MCDNSGYVEGRGAVNPGRIIALICAWGILCHAAVARASGFDAFFKEGTIRVDLWHAASAEGDRYYLDEIRAEPAWPGSRTRLIDEDPSGRMLAEIFPIDSEAPIFSTSFDTLCAEWQSTGPALAGEEKIFHESIRIPCPREPVRMTIRKRVIKRRFLAPWRRAARMEHLFEMVIDPDSPWISRELRHADLKVIALHETGPPSERADILFLGDGYTAGEMEKFRHDVRRFADDLLAAPPFADNRDKINVWAIEVISRESGPDEPRKGIFRDTALGCTFNTFDSPRYLTTEHNKAMREIAANAPYDTLYLMVNSSRYGGGGIYNLYSVFVSDTEYDDYVCIHELGHGFGGLADEYYTSSIAYSDFYPRGIEPSEPNITALLDPAQLKWADLIAPGTPIPTLENERYKDVVGCFEGAGYAAKGLFRPAMNCKMFSKGRQEFCPVCSRAIEERIRRESEKRDTP